MRSVLLIIASAIGIIACGAVGVAAGLAVRGALSLEGLPGALVTLFVAMVVATLAWAVGTAAMRALRLIR
jgi:hypothetical protein